jgi:hypothetical protein
MLSELIFKIRFRIDIKFKSDFETKDIFQKWKAMIFERFQGGLVSNLNLIRISTKAKAFYSHYKSRAIH